MIPDTHLEFVRTLLAENTREVALRWYAPESVYLDERTIYAIVDERIAKIVSDHPNADSRIIYSTARSIDPQPCGWTYLDRGKDEWWLDEIGVLARFRGTGIGEKQLKGIIRESLDENIAIYLKVTQDNKRAIKLYERLGFTKVGLIDASFVMRGPTADLRV